jgi:DNA-binding transcriptional ArsR family regulator
MKTPEALKALAALAQDTRLAIYRLLVQAGKDGCSVGTIADKLDLPGATLSFHLKELANAALIEARQEGRFIYYSANYARMNGLLAYLTENCCQGRDCEAVCAPGPRKRAAKAAA